RHRVASFFGDVGRLRYELRAEGAEHRHGAGSYKKESRDPISWHHGSLGAPTTRAQATEHRSYRPHRRSSQVLDGRQCAQRGRSASFVLSTVFDAGAHRGGQVRTLRARDASQTAAWARSGGWRARAPRGDGASLPVPAVPSGGDGDDGSAAAEEALWRGHGWPGAVGVVG